MLISATVEQLADPLAVLELVAHRLQGDRKQGGAGGAIENSKAPRWRRDQLEVEVPQLAHAGKPASRPSLRGEVKRWALGASNLAPVA